MESRRNRLAVGSGRACYVFEYMAPIMHSNRGERGSWILNLVSSPSGNIVWDLIRDTPPGEPAVLASKSTTGGITVLRGQDEPTRLSLSRLAFFAKNSYETSRDSRNPITLTSDVRGRGLTCAKVFGRRPDSAAD